MAMFLLGILLLPMIHSGIAATQDEECIQSSCSKHGPAIRFPFRLKDRQPSHCGYPGFDLSCTEKKQTIFELPNSQKLYVRKIDYQSQVLQVYDPDSCLLSRSSLANLKSSIFRYHFHHYDHNNFTLLNCTSFSSYSYMFEVSCLRSSSSGYQVYAVSSDFHMGWVNFSSCTKLYDILSVPVDMPYKTHLLLDWFKPNCIECEASGRKCKLKNNSTVQTQCYGKLNTTKGGKAKLWIAISVPVSLILVPSMVILSYIVYRTDKADKETQAKVEKFLEDYRALKPARYSYADVKRITDNFKEKLGQGSYGTVYKGKLSKEISVAVKILNDSTGNGVEFINEVALMGRIHHVNVVRLIGYCADGFRRALVYDFLQNESLDKFIFQRNGRTIIGRQKLNEIAMGVAKGIEYLHQGCEQRILHFDIKPHNVLLDEDFNPKISDFGLAKLCSKDQSAVSMTAARGTMGYIAPEVLSRNFGTVSHKSDVYSYGMLLLEMVGGRNNTDENNSNQIYFPEWAYSRLEQGEEVRIEIEEEGEDEIVKKLIIVGLWCIQWNPVDRPSMKIVAGMLEGEGDDLPMPPNPFASAGNKRKTISADRNLRRNLETIGEAE